MGDINAAESPTHYKQMRGKDAEGKEPCRICLGQSIV
jgi:hypothetical protein